MRRKQAVTRLSGPWLVRVCYGSSIIWKGGNVFNALYPAAADLQPGLETAKRALETSGAHYVLMTGSGAAVYGAYNSDAQAIKAAEQLRQTFPGAFVACAATLS